MIESSFINYTNKVFVQYENYTIMVDWWNQKRRFASLLKLAGYLKAYFKDNALIESENWDFKSYKTHWKIPCQPQVVCEMFTTRCIR